MNCLLVAPPLRIGPFQLNDPKAASLDRTEPEPAFPSTLLRFSAGSVSLLRADRSSVSG